MYREKIRKPKLDDDGNEINESDGFWGGLFGKSKEEKGSENLAMADTIFKSIKDYGFLHSSHFISEALNEAILVELDSV